MISETRPLQAVVLIHGMGEQMPMTTLRGFVHDIIATEQGDGAAAGWRV